MQTAGFSSDTYGNRSRLIALRDFLARVFSNECHAFSDRSRGSGKSGLIAMDKPGQEISIIGWAARDLNPRFAKSLLRRVYATRGLPRRI